jgi:hypothetical protein
VKLTIYLLPDRGPITPVELDLVEIFRTLTPPRPADGLSQDHLRILCDAILRADRRFAGIRLERSRAGLSRIYANFGHADRFDGVVLRVEGEIAPESEQARNGRAEQAGAIAAEIEARDRTIRELRGEVWRAQQAEKAQRALLDDVTNRLQEVTRALEREQSGGADLRRQAESWRAELSRARAEHGALADTVKQLRDTLAERDRELAELRARRRPADEADPRGVMLD